MGKRGLKTWEKNLARLRKETWGRLITVEFDGKTMNVNGGGPEWDEFKGGIQA